MSAARGASAGFVVCAVFVVACRRADCPQPRELADPPSTVATPEVWLEWTMRREATDEGEWLVIDYTAHNDNEQPVYLLDRIMTADGVDDEKIIVMNAETPGIVALVRAPIWPRVLPVVEQPEWRPAARLLERNASVQGRAYTEWPLRAWPAPLHGIDAAGPYDPLRGTPTRAILEIAYVIVDGPEEMEAVPLEGSPLPLLFAGPGADLRLLVGEIQPLP